MNGATLTLSTAANGTGSQPPAGTASSSGVPGNGWSGSFGDSFALTYGTGAGQVNSVVCQDRTLAASASEELDLSDGSLVNVFGAAAAMTKVLAVAVYKIANPDGSTPGGSITVGNAGTNPLPLNLGGTAPTYTVYDGGPAFLAAKAAGFTVGDSTKRLKIANDDGTNASTYRIIIAGQV